MSDHSDHAPAATTVVDVRPGRWRALNEKFLVEERVVAAPVERRLYWISAMLMLIGLVCFGVILADVLGKDGLSTIDTPIARWLDSLRTPPLTVVTIVVATVFGPIALPIIVLIVTVTWGILAKHLWRPLLLAAGTITGVIVVQIITHAVGRHRPPANLMLIGTDTTYSFPSGHVLGACDFLLLTTYLVFSRRHAIGAAVAAYLASAVLVFATAFSRVYLGYHWPTDALASMSLSLVIVGAVIAVDTRRTVRVRERQPVDPPDETTT